MNVIGIKTFYFQNYVLYFDKFVFDIHTIVKLQKADLG